MGRTGSVERGPPLLPERPDEAVREAAVRGVGDLQPLLHRVERGEDRVGHHGGAGALPREEEPSAREAFQQPPQEERRGRTAVK